MRTSHRLRSKPLADFSVEELRIMIGQQLSLEVLVPIAVGRLRDNPLVTGDFYEGDLLCSVLRLPASFWREHPALRREVLALVGATRLPTWVGQDLARSPLHDADG